MIDNKINELTERETAQISELWPTTNKADIEAYVKLLDAIEEGGDTVIQNVNGTITERGIALASGGISLMEENGHVKLCDYTNHHEIAIPITPALLTELWYLFKDVFSEEAK